MMDASSIHQPIVAIVDDDREVRKLFCMALRSLPAELHEYDGQQSFLASLDSAIPEWPSSICVYLTAMV